MTFTPPFPHRTLFPVIHVEKTDQALRNARLARDAGADGVFLINHDIAYPALLEAYAACRRNHPSWWIGLNGLDLPPHEAFRRAPVGVDGVWTDSGGSGAATRERGHLRQRGWKGLHFGGVAFKGQPRADDVAAEARAAVPRMDVLTTSGPATGHAAAPEKLRVIRETVGPRVPIALASGVTPENVAAYLPYVDAFLVATGISVSHAELDPARVRRLADLIHAS